MKSFLLAKVDRRDVFRAAAAGVAIAAERDDGRSGRRSSAHRQRRQA